MPGGNGTGPDGFGPMTGRGAGFCTGNNRPGYANQGTGRGGAGFGRAGGFRGRGFRNRFYATGMPYQARYGRGYNQYPPVQNTYMQPEITPESEIDMLKREAKYLQDDLKSINERVTELQNIAGQED